MLVETNLAGVEFAVSVAGNAAQHGAAILVDDVDVLAGSVERHDGYEMGCRGVE